MNGSDGDLGPGGDLGRLDALRDDAYHVERPGADLYVEQVGPDAAPAVYYLHGGPAYGAHSFRDLLGHDLLRYRMVYADQRGGGRSYADSPFDLSTLADDVAAVLGALGLASVSLLAHGFGATVAVRAAARHPELIERLVLAGPWLSMPMLARTLQRTAAQVAGDGDTALPPEAALAHPVGLDPQALADEAFGLVSGKVLFDTLQFPDPSARLRLEHSDATALLGPTATAELADPWTVDVLDELAASRIPLAVLAGTRDGTSFPDQVEAALTRRPDAVSGLLDTGHYPWLEEPDSFLRLLHDALAHG
jgi:proline iminopeptidase